MIRGDTPLNCAVTLEIAGGAANYSVRAQQVPRTEGFIIMKIETMLKVGARVKVLQVKGDLAQELRVRGIRHCGTDLRPVEPATNCRFCGGDCDGLH